MENALQILKNTFGYHDFRHHQAEIIQTLNDGQDALVLMPTGGGKSLCFQIPALLRDGTGIVISPLIALMQDQVDALRQSGLRAAFLNSTQDSGTQSQIEQSLVKGELDLLYIAPERLLTQRMLNLLKASELALFAIDEAHCVSQWGHDFRKDYQQLSVLPERFPGVPRIALTATADAEPVQKLSNSLTCRKPRFSLIVLTGRTSVTQSAKGATHVTGCGSSCNRSTRAMRVLFIVCRARRSNK